jgi:hypothetical protein
MKLCLMIFYFRQRSEKAGAYIQKRYQVGQEFPYLRPRKQRFDTARHRRKRQILQNLL